MSMTPDELRQRMIEVAIEVDADPMKPTWEYDYIVDGLLAAGAAEQWVMPWMECTNPQTTRAQRLGEVLATGGFSLLMKYVPFYRMKEPK